MPQTVLVRLILLADTHVPARARDLPPQVWAAVDNAEVVLHAGDGISLDLVERLAGRARRRVACHGNNGGPPIRAVLPETVRVTLDGLRFVIVHETGAAAGRTPSAREGISVRRAPSGCCKLAKPATRVTGRRS